MQQGQHWGLHGSVLLQPPWELLPVELRGWRSAGRAVWTQNARSGEGDSELLTESWRWGGDRGAGVKGTRCGWNLWLQHHPLCQREARSCCHGRTGMAFSPGGKFHRIFLLPAV